MKVANIDKLKQHRIARSAKKR